MRATLSLFLVAVACVVLLPGCSRGRGAGAPAPQPVAGPEQPGAGPEASPEAPALPASLLRFVPSQSRVFMRGDSDEIVMQWMPVGMSFESAQGQVLHGLLLEETSFGEEVLSPLSPVAVLSATAWERAAGAYRRSYSVKSLDPNSPVSGTVDSAQCLLVTAESGGLAAGFLERRISVDGGESDYNVLAVVADGAVTLVDTSAWIFPESFHPSGVRGVTIGDVNGDGSLEIVVSVETIVSLNYLGATPLAWECWLPARSPASGPLFQFNESFATDEGSSYTASRRLVDSDGDGVRETAKVTTDIEEASEEREFANRIVSFYLWDGSRYAKQAADELPRLGSVAVELATLFADPDIESGSVAEAAQGELLYVFDRSDSPPFWFRAVTKRGAEGWIAGSDVQMAWVDPLKVNREVFLAP